MTKLDYTDKALGHRPGTPQSSPSTPAGGGEPVAWREPAGDAEAFIAKLVNMQSGQGWSRSVVREAAANFLAERGIKPPHGPDSTPEIIARTSPDAAQQRIRELEEALRELLTDMSIAQGNMREAARYDNRWEGCAEAIQPRVDRARTALGGDNGDAS